MDPNINLKMSWRTSYHYPLFRLAEQYLNCAEAWNEYLIDRMTKYIVLSMQ